MNSRGAYGSVVQAQNTVVGGSGLVLLHGAPDPDRLAAQCRRLIGAIDHHPHGWLGHSRHGVDGDAVTGERSRWGAGMWAVIVVLT